MSRTNHHGHRQKVKKFGDNYHWYLSEPKAWRRQYKHKLRRSEARKCINDVLYGDSDKEVMFPLDTKPWIYYW
jgi:hypothetical protein